MLLSLDALLVVNSYNLRDMMVYLRILHKEIQGFMEIKQKRIACSVFVRADCIG
jgi:hypothetical protein